jgi:hypothetical protein
VAEKWIRDPEVLEDFCNLLKQCMSSLSDSVRPFTQDMVMLLSQCYDIQPLSCTLELARCPSYEFSSWVEK